MSVLVVVPSIASDWTARCLEGLKIDPGDLLVVDNTAHNRGVAASWNLGVTQVLEEQRDWLVLLSAGVRFGPAGGREFFEALQASDAACVEAADGLGWHLLAISRETLHRVGSFDENFFPAYLEDNDWSYRFGLAGGGAWPKVPVDAHLEGVAHGIQAGVVIPWHALRRYYRRKWGGLSPHEIFRHPFNDPNRAIDWRPQPEHAR